MLTSNSCESGPLRLPLNDLLAERENVQLLSPPGTVWILRAEGKGSESPDPIAPVNFAIQCADETWQFAESNGLLQAVMKYTGLANHFFKIVGSASCRLSQDPETNERFLTLDISITGSFDDILSSEDRFRDIGRKSSRGQALLHSPFI